MKGKEIRRSMPVFPIGTMMTLTDLTARQIRYYEEQGLIIPKRSQTNRRLYSLNDVDKLLEIKDYLAEGLTIVAIKKKYTKVEKEKEQPAQKFLTDEDVRRIFYQEMMNQQEWRHDR
ncbi:MerR family transcriptional regulator [Granulicatella sp. zg-ZJ]|uniref:MerR family transcriptional regulator n=1 Tax=unclassified Granulicatella TaxID=2630493 RepID=UPI0013C063ED|nr:MULTISPECIES: MerR family transcriptional regulator [unclassified Granulicatella]MBS4750217.1 MerR family transcriptional regulator [Carnobacteriaceae bacterium zg-ZUI78]NEW63345.1 MerR family transcriptional regulator [Granulicatella sp. zg-ZJ]NEW65687.1 MerR family transcriptional regulator [Granulicatella sp. zg-84]QMI85673.1 MerR family transcriptional regulator [Carnobacteriaceae bacterium zg-84]